MTRPGFTAALALCAALAALAPARPARADAPERPPVPPPPAQLPPPGTERVEVHVRFPPWQYTGTFRIETASGAVLDEGVARDGGGFFAGGGAVDRVLEGGRGVLVLRVVSGAKCAGLPPILGRWTVERGTGAYAATRGSGTFTSASSGEVRTGSPFELQTLIGHVRWK